MYKYVKYDIYLNG